MSSSDGTEDERTAAETDASEDLELDDETADRVVGGLAPLGKLTPPGPPN